MVVVETRTGAAGLISSQALKAAAPDGTTLMVEIKLYNNPMIYMTFHGFVVFE